MESYEPEKIEPKWQKYWEKKGFYKAHDFSEKSKLFLLLEFPYPSGTGLHIGHCRPYTGLDVIARRKRMEGYNVLFPMGWDAFGLPTENYAIKTGIHPAIVTEKGTETFKKQQKRLGFSFDWSREINTTDPSYYKWTQWIFLKLFEKGLAYKAKMPINWCLSCKIGLANEEVVDGKCERCGGDVEKREKEQWLIKITKYAERLIQDLDLVDFPERVKTLQKDWIGKSDGWEIDFEVLPAKNKSGSNHNDRYGLNQVKVFTTRIDTLFGCTYLVVAPEHEIISNFKSQITNIKGVEEYIERAKKKSERDRQADVKDKTGVRLEGVVGVNPANGKEIPIFAADYVLMGYGTGAIMAVPAHDQRDFEFAKKYNLPYPKVILPPELNSVFVSPVDVALGKKDSVRIESECWEGEGNLINSEQFNGLNSSEAREKIGQWLAEKGLAQKQIHYKLRDWVFSRQRYWGEPIPLVFCEKCGLRDPSGQGWVAIPEKDLPVELPDIKDYKPTDKGDSPLAKIDGWVNTKCPKCGRPGRRETDVMPNWAGSNWYFMRYCDPKNNKEFALPEKLKYWMPVDWYNGGMEHTTLHLLYSRFIYKFLWDIGAVPKELGPEPYKKRTSHGMVLAENKIKMSKSKCNVINPDDVIKEYGADTLRVYEMFMGPFDQAIAWDTKGVRGVYRFLQKIYKLNFQTNSKITNSKLEKLLNKTIKKVSEDIEAMKFNTAVSALMILANAMEREQEISSEIFKKFLLILAPFAPHLAEELWHKTGEKESIFLSQWPKYDKGLLEDEKINLIVQINGKARGSLEVARDIEQAKVVELVKAEPRLNKWLENKKEKKVVFVKNKFVNFVI